MESKFAKNEPVVNNSGILVLFKSESEGFSTIEYFSTKDRGIYKSEEIKPYITEDILNEIILKRPPKSILKVDVAIADIVNWINQLYTTDEGRESFEKCMDLAGEFPIPKLIKAVQALRPLGIQTESFDIDSSKEVLAVAEA